jgi:hypothetical protein
MALLWFSTRLSPLVQVDPQAREQLPGQLNNRKAIASYYFTTALLLLYYFFTAASLLLYYCFTTAFPGAGEVSGDRADPRAAA